MAISRIKRCVASRIANSSHRMPTSLQRWAENHSSQASSKSSSSDTSPGSPSSPPPATTQLSSSSTLPVLELSLEATKIITRSCLKKPRQGRWADPREHSYREYAHREHKYRENRYRELAYRENRRREQALRDRGFRPRRHPGPSKRVSFAYDSVLLTCIDTGLHIQPVARGESESTYTKRDASAHVYGEVRGKNKAPLSAANTNTDDALARLAAEVVQRGIMAASPKTAPEPAFDMTSDGPQQPSGDDDDDEPDYRDVYGPFDREEQRLNDLLYDATLSSNTLEYNSIRLGGLDFALYVTRTPAAVEVLEALARSWGGKVRIASYFGDERRWAFFGGTVTTQLPQDMYEDHRSSMSGCREPRVVMRVSDLTIKSAEAVGEEITPVVEDVRTESEEERKREGEDAGEAADGDVKVVEGDKEDDQVAEKA